MAETDEAGMQALTMQKGQPGTLGSVNRITGDGMAQVGHVHADLMGASGLQLQTNMGKTGVTGEHLVMGHSRAGILIGHRHLLAVGGMAANGRIDRA